MHYKIAALRAMISRAFTHVTKWNDKEKELNYIREIANKHGYSRKIMKGVLEGVTKRITDRSAVKTDAQNEERRYFSQVLYYPNTDKVLKRAIKQGTKNMGNKRGQNLFGRLRNDKDPVEKSKKAGI